MVGTYLLEEELYTNICPSVGEVVSTSLKFAILCEVIEDTVPALPDTLPVTFPTTLPVILPTNALEVIELNPVPTPPVIVAVPSVMEGDSKV